VGTFSAALIGKKDWNANVKMPHNTECSGGVHPLNRTFFEGELNQRFAAKKKLQASRKAAMAEAKEKETAEQANEDEGVMRTGTAREGAGEGTGGISATKKAWGPDVKSSAEAEKLTWMLKKTKGELMQEKHAKQQQLRKKMKKQLHQLQRRKLMFEAHVNPSFIDLFNNATRASNVQGTVAMQIDKNPRTSFKGFKQGKTKTPTMPWTCLSDRAVQTEDPKFYRTDQALKSASPRRGSALARERPCTHVNHISPAFCEACNAPRKTTERRMLADLERQAEVTVTDLWSQAIEAVE
jgi:hypothetical protein